MMSGRTLGARGASLLAAAGSLLGGAGPALLPGGVGVSPALGQVEGTATWLWEVSTPDGDAIVEPGETATVRLSIDLSPSPGEQGVQAFGSAIWDTLGGTNAATGGIVDWQVNPQLTFHIGDTTLTDGVNLYFSNAAQLGDICCDESDPIWIMDFTWGTDDYSPRTVEYTTMTSGGLTYVWLNSDLWKYTMWRTIEATPAFLVIPTPGAGLIIGAGVMTMIAFRAGARSRGRPTRTQRIRTCRFIWTGTPGKASLAVLNCCAAASAQVEVLIAFDGINGYETNELDSVPADPEIAVGLGELVTVVNSRVATYSKDGQAIDAMELKDFFNVAVQPIDSKLIYDPWDNLYVLSALGSGLIRFAWVPGDDPEIDPADLGNWTKSSVVSTFVDPCGTQIGLLPADRPNLGFDDKAWYLAAPLDFLGQVTGADSMFVVIDKSDGSTQTVLGQDFIDFSGPGDPVALGCLTPGFAGVQAPTPAEAWGTEPPPVAYFIGVGAKVLGSCPCITGQGHSPMCYDTLRIYSIGDPQNNPPTDLQFVEVQVPCFDARNVLELPTSDTPTSGRTITGGDGRITGVVFREETGTPFLYAVHSTVKPVTIDNALVVRKVVRWYKLKTNGWPIEEDEVPTVDNYGEFVGPARSAQGQSPGYAVSLCFPDLAVNDNGDMAVVMIRTSVLEAPSIRVTGCIGNFFPPTLIKSSDVDDPPFNEEFGDYSDIKVDPEDGTTLRGIGEYMKTFAGQDPHWSTWIFSFTLDCSE